MGAKATVALGTRAGGGPAWPRVVFGLIGLVFAGLFALDLSTLAGSGRIAWSAFETADLGALALAAILAATSGHDTARSLAVGAVVAGVIAVILSTFPDGVVLVPVAIVTLVSAGRVCPSREQRLRSVAGGFGEMALLTAALLLFYG